MLGLATGTWTHKTHHGLDLGVSHHLTPYSILCSSPWRPHPNGTNSRGLPKWSPEIVPPRLLELWTAITPDCRIGSRRGLNQSCSPRRDLSNAMSHFRIGHREEVDSPSFAHNLGSRCPNCQCEGIFDIYVFKTFPMTPRTPQCEVFCALLSSSEHSGVPEDSNSQLFQVLGFTPTLGQSGVATGNFIILSCTCISKSVLKCILKHANFQYYAMKSKNSSYWSLK